MQDSQRKGWLIVVEGIDGAGKSTVLKQLAGYCQEQGIAHVLSREPTNGPWGTKLRESARTGRLSLDTELEYFIQDRREHVQNLIAPALAAGKVVLLDRYYFSTAAYQGARGADPEAILAANEVFAPQPDLVLLLDIDPTTGRSRITGRGDTPDGFEGAEALAKTRQIFLSLRRPYIQRIDAAGNPGAVASQAIQLLAAVVAKPR